MDNGQLLLSTWLDNNFDVVQDWIGNQPGAPANQEVFAEKMQYSDLWGDPQPDGFDGSFHLVVQWSDGTKSEHDVRASADLTGGSDE